MARQRSNRNQTCTQCGQGHYTETSYTDDMYGILHCSHCGHEVDTWVDIDEEENLDTEN